MTVRKFFYILIGIEILALAILVAIAVKGKGSISLCRYDMTHPFGYITPGDVALIKQIYGNAAKTTCSKNVFTAIYFTIYALLATTGVYLLILLTKLFTGSPKESKTD